MVNGGEIGGPWDYDAEEIDMEEFLEDVTEEVIETLRSRSDTSDRQRKTNSLEESTESKEIELEIQAEELSKILLTTFEDNLAKRHDPNDR